MTDLLQRVAALPALGDKNEVDIPRTRDWLQVFGSDLGPQPPSHPQRTARYIGWEAAPPPRAFEEGCRYQCVSAYAVQERR